MASDAPGYSSSSSSSGSGGGGSGGGGGGAGRLGRSLAVARHTCRPATVSRHLISPNPHQHYRPSNPQLDVHFNHFLYAPFLILLYNIF